MSYVLQNSDINSLIYQYFLERGLHHSAFLLKHEAEDLKTELPEGSLVSYLEKSLTMEELHHHSNQEVRLMQEPTNNCSARCVNEFRLNHTHHCAYKVEICEKQNGHSDELKLIYLLSGHNGLVSLLDSWKGLLVSGYLLVRSKDGTVRLWKFKQEISTYEQCGILPHMQGDRMMGWVKQFGINQFGSIVSLGSEGIVRIWPSSGLLSSTIQASSTILSAQWDTSGHYIIANTSSSLDLWDELGYHKRSFTLPKNSILLSATSRSPSEFTIQTTDSVLALRQNQAPVTLYTGKTDIIKWSPSKTFLAIQEGANIAIYQDNCELWWLNQENSSFEFAYKGNSLASGSILGDVCIWDLEQRSIYLRVPTSIGKIYKLSFRKDDEIIAVQGENELQVCLIGENNVIRKVKVSDKIETR